MIDLKQWAKEIKEEQPDSYILAAILQLILSETTWSDKRIEETLTAIKGGWYVD